MHGTSYIKKCTNLRLRDIILPTPGSIEHFISIELHEEKVLSSCHVIHYLEHKNLV